VFQKIRLVVSGYATTLQGTKWLEKLTIVIIMLIIKLVLLKLYKPSLTILYLTLILYIKVNYL